MNAQASEATLKFEQRAVDELVPYARNARKHPKAQIEKLCASIREFGFVVPVLIDGANNVIAGHGRIMAAKALGIVTVPTVQAGHLSDRQRRLLTIADNKIAEEAKWLDDVLAGEMAELAALGADLGVTGFSEVDVDRLLQAALGRAPSEGHTNPDSAPPAAKNGAAVSRVGDLWEIGSHRLLCGDSTAAADVARLLAAERPNLMVTDPPYGVNYDPEWRKSAGLNKACATGKVKNDDLADWRTAWKLFPGAVAYVWHAGRACAVVAESLAYCGFKLRAQIIWVKSRPVIGRGNYHYQHEPALYATQDGADDHWRFVPEHEVAAYAVLDGETADWHGGRKQSTVWFIEHLKNDTGHGTQKPIECMRRPIINNSSPGDCVYEPFSGSGTTIIACEMTGRRARAIELDPAYVDVAVRRRQEFTGKVARLAGDGRSFAEIAAVRDSTAAAA